MPKKDKKPITSVIVVTKTLDAIAGSILNFFKDIGTKIPNKPATIIFKTIEIDINKFEDQNKKKKNLRIFIAYYIGSTRLIDNI